MPVLTQLRDEMDRVRERELAAALRRLGDLTPEQRAAVEHFSQSLMNKFLHEPSVRLRAAAANGRGLGVVDAARYLFALDDRGRRRRAGRRRPTHASDHEPDETHEARRSSPAGRASSARTSAERFLAEGWTVHVLDNLVTGKRENVPARRRRSTSSTSATRRRRR